MALPRSSCENSKNPEIALQDKYHYECMSRFVVEKERKK